jgi:endoglucanase
MNASSVQWMVDNWHINIIRISMYGDYGDKGYVNDSTCADTVVRWVDYCIAQGIYAIIDWHTLADDRNPLNYKDQAIHFFLKMANKYKNFSNVLYEICNEPNGFTPTGDTVTWVDDIKPYAEAVIPAIRAIDPDGVAICGIQGYSGNLDAVRPVLSSSYTNVLYTYHFYAASTPLGIVGGGWSPNKMLNDFLNAGGGIFVTEWGTVQNSGQGNPDTTASRVWMNFLKDKKISHCGWQLSATNETSAILVAGAPTTGGWTSQYLTESGKWMSAYWTANADAGLPMVTEIKKSLPVRTRILSGKSAAMCFDLHGRKIASRIYKGASRVAAALFFIESAGTAVSRQILAP